VSEGARRTRIGRRWLEGGGKVILDVLDDGGENFDLSLISAEGASAAVYLTRDELRGLASSLDGFALVDDWSAVKGLDD
jgi:hypothetical protein